MNLSDALDQGLKLVPTCSALCLVDFQAGLVLGKASIKPVPQEHFDKLADRAARLFSDDLRLTQLSGAEELDQFAVYAGDVLQVYARAPNEPEQALCYQCRPEGDAAAIFHSVRLHRNNVAEFLLES